MLFIALACHFTWTLILRYQVIKFINYEKFATSHTMQDDLGVNLCVNMCSRHKPTYFGYFQSLKVQLFEI